MLNIVIIEIYEWKIKWIFSYLEKEICLLCEKDKGLTRKQFWEAYLIHWIVCQDVTSHTSSMSVIVSRNSSNPSLWWGVVNLTINDTLLSIEQSNSIHTQYAQIHIVLQLFQLFDQSFQKKNKDRFNIPHMS